jgi:hypothetical protein
VEEWRNVSHPLLTGKDGKTSYDGCHIRDLDYQKVCEILAAYVGQVVTHGLNIYNDTKP